MWKFLVICCACHWQWHPVDGLRVDESELDFGESLDLPDSPKTDFWDWMRTRNIILNATVEAEKIAQEQPTVLAPNEVIELAFKVGRVKTFFTSSRIMVKTRHVFSSAESNRRSFWSLPYSAIKAYAVETSGTFLDKHTSLTVYTKMPGMAESQFIFRNYTDGDEGILLAVNALMSQKTLGVQVDALTSFDQFGQRWTLANALNQLLDLPVRNVDETQVEARLRETVPILGDDEHLTMAFQNGRDYVVLSNLRVIVIDVKFLTGKRASFLSIPWKEVQTWDLKTTGVIDLDSNLRIRTELPSLPSTRVDVWRHEDTEAEINWRFAQHILGLPNNLRAPVSGDNFATLFKFGLFRFPTEFETAERTAEILAPVVPSLILPDEQILFSIRDLLTTGIFTNKRFVRVRRQGATSVHFESLPWANMGGFTFRYDNHFFFLKSITLEMFTRVHPGDIPIEENQTNQEEALTSLTVQFFDVFLKPDLPWLHTQMSDFMLGTATPFRAPQFGVETQKLNENFTEWLREKKGEPPAAEVNEVMGELLVDGEEAQYALRVWRATLIFTNKRIINARRKGLFGRILDIQSVEYNSVNAYLQRSSGMIRIGAEFTIWLNLPGSSSIHYALSLWNGVTTGVGPSKALATNLLRGDNAPQAAASFFDRSEGNPLKYLSGLLGTVTESEAEEKIRTGAPLLDDEKIEYAYGVGRDLTVFTDSRVIQLDVQMLSGKQKELISVPYSSCLGWYSEPSSETFDWSSHLELYTMVEQHERTSQIWADFDGKASDIMGLDSFIRSKLMPTTA